MIITRKDGRSEREARSVGIVYEGLDRVDGSARFAFGMDTPFSRSVRGANTY